MKLDDIREMAKALREAPNYNAGLGTSTLEDEAADLIDELTAEVERMAEEMQNAEIHADCMEARAIAYEAEVERLREGQAEDDEEQGISQLDMLE